MAAKAPITAPRFCAVMSSNNELSPDAVPFKQSLEIDNNESLESSTVQSRWMSVRNMAYHYQKVISEQALRSLIWEAEAYGKNPKSGLKSNGFLPVIVRPPNQRKVLLDRFEFEKWLTSRQRTDRN